MALRGTHHRNRSGNPIGIARGTSNNEPAASQTLARRIAANIAKLAEISEVARCRLLCAHQQT
jgi:hypothetical protein